MKDEMLKDEIDCAEMIGMTVEEYRNSLKEIKIPAKKEYDNLNVNYDNSFLNYLGIDNSLLKKQKKINNNR